MTKENNIKFKKFETPNFDQFNDVIQNNIKIYNDIIQGKNPKSTSKDDKVNHKNQKKNEKNEEFTAIDLLNLINPTATKITKTLLDTSNKISKNPNLLYEHTTKWIQQIVSLNFYFISKISNQDHKPVIEPNKTDKRFTYKVNK